MIHYDPMSQLPFELANTISQNPAALDAFGRRPGQEKSHYMTGFHHVNSMREVNTLLSELGYPDSI